MRSSHDRVRNHRPAENEFRDGLIAVKKAGAQQRLRYHRVPEMSRKSEKLGFLAEGNISWGPLTPDADSTWLVPAHADEYRGYASLPEIFALHTVGVKTNRDAVV
jgi:hypothetical protein